jgi:hypothetical protein
MKLDVRLEISVGKDYSRTADSYLSLYANLSGQRRWYDTLALSDFRLDLRDGTVAPETQPANDYLPIDSAV